MNGYGKTTANREPRLKYLLVAEGGEVQSAGGAGRAGGRSRRARAQALGSAGSRGTAETELLRWKPLRWAARGLDGAGLCAAGVVSGELGRGLASRGLRDRSFGLGVVWRSDDLGPPARNAREYPAVAGTPNAATFWVATAVQKDGDVVVSAPTGSSPRAARQSPVSKTQSPGAIAKSRTLSAWKTMSNGGISEVMRSHIPGAVTSARSKVRSRTLPFGTAEAPEHPAATRDRCR